MDGSAILARLRGRLGAQVLETHEHHGDHPAVVAREGIVDALPFSRDDALLRFDMLMDLTAVDYLTFPGREDGPRFDVVYHLYSVPHNHRVRLKGRVEQDGPSGPPPPRPGRPSSSPSPRAAGGPPTSPTSGPPTCTAPSRRIASPARTTTPSP